LSASRDPARVALLLALAALLLAAVTFSRFSETSPWSFPRFLLVLVALVYLPGKALIDRLRPRPLPLEDLALSLGLGLVVSSACYAAFAVLGPPPLVWLLAPLAAGALVLRREGGWNVAAPGWAHAALVGLLVAACVPLAVLPTYYRNLDRVGGALSYYPWPDAIVRLSLARALSHAIPTDVPSLPGTPLRYHFGMDLIVAMFARVGALDVGDLTVRFVPTLLLTLLVLASFCFARAFLGSAPAGLLFAALVVLGDDLAWLPGLLRGAPAPWSIYFFGMPTVMSLYGLNPMLPALALLLLGLLALLGVLRDGRRGWLALASVLLASVAAYKVFAAAQALAALGLAALVFLVRDRDRRLAAVFGIAAALAALIATALTGGAPPRAVLRVDPWPYVPAALIRSGLFGSWLGRQIEALWARGSLTPGTLFAFFGVALPAYLAATFGARMLGLRRLVRALKPGRGEAIRLLLAVFVLLGPPLALLLAITPAGYPPHERYNETAWFLVQSKFLAWIFAVEALLATSAGRALRAAALSLAVLAVSLPAPLQFFVHQASLRETRFLGSQELGLLDFLRGRDPGDVAVARPEIGEAMVAFTSCRVLVLTVHPYYSMSAAELEQHQRRQEEFWAAWREGRLRRDLLEAYGASLIVVDKQQDGSGPAAEPALQRRYENGRYLVLSYARP
jgi:hypothetical protein